MAGKRKAEGIALLSLYNDDEEEDQEEGDDDTDDEEEAAQQHNDEQPQVAHVSHSEEQEQEQGVPDHHGHDQQPQAVPDFMAERPSPPRTISPLLASAQDQASIVSPQALSDRSGGGAYGIIVDYEHDEPALSPEAEEGEILSTGRAILGLDIQASNGFPPGGGQSPGIGCVLTPEKGLLNLSDDQTEHLNVSTTDVTANRDAAVEAAASTDVEMADTEVVDIVASQADPLADFLPPPPTTKCSEELQQKFTKYLSFKNAGRSFNEELRKSKGYRNPDFLQRAVKYQEIDQIGSCFRKEIFDPHGFDSSDFYDAIALEVRREMERKEQAKKQSQRVDFVHGGVQAAPTTTLPDKTKPAIPALGGQKALTGPTTVNASSSAGAQAATAENPSKLDGRSSKKSKWDKVDTDGRAPPALPAVAKTAIAAASAHAALLTANAGAGYASFAQQKRKEAEERSRVSDKGAIKSEKK